MISIAKAFMFLGAVAGVFGITGCLVLVIAWINDRIGRRDHRPTFQPENHTGQFTTPLCGGDKSLPAQAGKATGTAPASGT